MQFAIAMLRTLSSLQFSPALKQVPRVNFLELKRIATSLSDVFSGCAFGHGNMLRTRVDGVLALQCEDCGHITRVLDKPAIKGPKLHPEPVKGAPRATATRVVNEGRTYPRSA
jgi:hypothetical protein